MMYYDILKSMTYMATFSTGSTNMSVSKPKRHHRPSCQLQHIHLQKKEQVFVDDLLLFSEMRRADQIFTRGLCLRKDEFFVRIFR